MLHSFSEIPLFYLDLVKEVALESPGFSLGDDAFLVDTPGLDAFGLKEHEALTLDVFLPTVDLAIFVTTAKANSDEIVRMYLDRLVANRTSIIMVQNMIDSVMPKLGTGGRIEKSERVVLEEHARRLHRLLEGSGSPLLQKTPIVQVSALHALKGPDQAKAAGITALVDRVRSTIEEHGSSREGARLLQLKKCLGRIRFDGVEENDMDAGPSLEKQRDTIESAGRALEETRESLESKITQLRQDLESAFERARSGLDSLQDGSSNIGQAPPATPPRLAARGKRFSNLTRSFERYS